MTEDSASASASAGQTEWQRESTATTAGESSAERTRDSLPTMPMRAGSVVESDAASLDTRTVAAAASAVPLDDTGGAASKLAAAEERQGEEEEAQAPPLPAAAEEEEERGASEAVVEKSPRRPVPSSLTQLENDVCTKLRSMGSTSCKSTGTQSPAFAAAAVANSQHSKQSQDNTSEHSTRVGAIAMGPAAAASHVQNELERLDRTFRQKAAFGQEGDDDGGLRIRLANGDIKHRADNTDDDSKHETVPDPPIFREDSVAEENARLGPQLRDVGCSWQFESEDEAPSLPLSDVSSTSSLSSVPTPAALAGLVEAELVDPEDQTILVVAKEVIRWKSRKGILLLVALFAIIFVPAVLITKFAIREDSAKALDRYNEESLRIKFEEDAHQLLRSLGARLELTMRAADIFMFEVVSQTHQPDSTWPLITIPHLAVKSAKLLSQTKSIYMAFYPLITADKRAEWENFTKYNDAWVEEGIQFQSRNPNFRGPTLEDYNISHVLWNNEGLLDPGSPGPFMPSWMGSPVIPYYYPYNWNALAYEAFSKPLLATMASKSVVFGPVANHADPNDSIAVAQAALTNAWAVPYLAEGEDTSEPFSDMYYPVIDMFDDVTLDVVNNDDIEALGSVAFSFYWRDVMKSVISNDSKGLVVVFQNPCGDQLFTYKLGGKAPTFLGYGDNHNPRYDNFIVSSKLTDLLSNNANALLYTGLPINSDFCPYTLAVYASDGYATDLDDSAEVPKSFLPLT